MDDLIRLTKQIIEYVDSGDLMSCYSLFEAEIRSIVESLEEDTSELVRLWKIQRGYVDEEDWAGVLENIENIREIVYA